MPSSAAVAAAKVESFESWRERFDLNCANCKVFGWKQPDPRNESLRKCTGCTAGKSFTAAGSARRSTGARYTRASVSSSLGGNVWMGQRCITRRLVVAAFFERPSSMQTTQTSSECLTPSILRQNPFWSWKSVILGHSRKPSKQI